MHTCVVQLYQADQTKYFVSGNPTDPLFLQNLINWNKYLLPNYQRSMGVVDKNRSRVGLKLAH